MQSATKKRVAEIRGCAGAVEKAFQYLAKVIQLSFWLHSLQDLQLNIHVKVDLC